MSTSNILSIETSCDETAVSVLRSEQDGFRILSNIVSSQVELHAQWGGVVPNLAAREHVKNIPTVLEQALADAKMTLSDIDLFSVVNGPGLIPALLVGTNFVKTLAYRLEKPLIGIHHIEGHIYANMVEKSKSREIAFPALCLVVSGGHTQIVLMKDNFRYEIVGQTLDDAVGEAFDKVARMLDVGYPGGPAVSRYAEEFAKMRHDGTMDHELSFPRPMLNKNDFDFSFSGLKTAVLYETKKNPELLKDGKYIAAVCHEFQQACRDVLIHKTLKAAEKYNPKTIMLAGGVSANKELRKQMGEAISASLHDTCYIIPDTSLTGDNAAMIAVATHFRWKKMSDEQKKKALSNWKTLEADATSRLA